MIKVFLANSLFCWILFGWSTDLRGDWISPQDFTVFAVHPDAQGQPTTRGRTIRDIVEFEGQLFTGYGDWAYDDGPVHLRSLDPQSGQWSNSLLEFGTEAVSHFRAIGGQLYAPSVDPRGVGVQPAGYAVANSAQSWNVQLPITATHVFDINQTLDGNMWLVGSVNELGTIWRSTDGGVNFTVERQDGPPASAPNYAFSRYAGAAVYNDNLYVQRVDVNSIHNPISLKFDGMQWTLGPDLLSQGTGFVFKPQEFASQLIYLDNDLSQGHLYRFDGFESRYAWQGLVHDFQVVEGYVVLLAEGGELLYSRDLELWQSGGFVPSEARSLELFDDHLFLGTTNAEILRSHRLISISAIPEPTIGLPLLCAIAVVARRRNRRGV